MNAVLETARLRLRPHGADDLDALAGIWADPVVTRFIGGRPQTREESWNRLLRYAGHWALLGHGYWAVVEKASNEVVGDVGVADFKRDGVDALIGVPELGWVLSSKVHGKGYATEAVAAVVAWAHAAFPRQTLACIIDTENAASLRVAEKVGFRAVAEVVYKGAPVLLFHHLSPGPS